MDSKRADYTAFATVSPTVLGLQDTVPFVLPRACFQRSCAAVPVWPCAPMPLCTCALSTHDRQCTP